MASTYSTILRIELIADGEQDNSWGGTLRTQIGTIVEAAIAGRSAVTHDNTANYTLTTVNGAADEARRAILNIAGALTAERNTVCPTQSKLYVIKNATTGGFATTLKTSTGTGISIPNGNTTFLMCDGTNVVNAIDYLSTLTIGNTLTVTAGGLTVTAGSVLLKGGYARVGATAPTTPAVNGLDVVCGANGTAFAVYNDNFLSAAVFSVQRSGLLRVEQSTSSREVHLNSDPVPYGLQINYSGAAPNGTDNQFIYCDDTAGLKGALRSNGGWANYSANNVNLSTRAVKNSIRLYTIEELLKYESFLEDVDFGVWKYNDQTHEDFNHGPTVEGVRFALRKHRMGLEEHSLIDVFDPKAGQLGLVTHDFANLTMASLVASNKRLRERVSALEARLQ